MYIYIIYKLCTLYMYMNSRTTASRQSYTGINIDNIYRCLSKYTLVTSDHCSTTMIHVYTYIEYMHAFVNIP